MIILSHINLSGINLGGINLSEIKLGMPSGKGTGGEELLTQHPLTRHGL